MVNQIKVEYMTKGENMKKCLNIMQELMKYIKNFLIKDMPKESNQLVDSMSKLVFKARMALHRKSNLWNDLYT